MMRGIRTSPGRTRLVDDGALVRDDIKGRRTTPTTRGDDGAILILALIYIIVISAMVTALTSWVTSDLKNTAKFTSAQAVESAANSATEAALQYVRYTFAASTINATPPVPCWSTANGQIAIGEQDTQMSVYCSTFYTPLNTKTRTVTISTCLSSLSAAACAASPLLQAVVIFNDYPTDGPSQCNPLVTTPTTTTTVSSGQSTCGTGMTIDSWAFLEAPPTITSVADPSQGTCPPAQLVQITGTGFSGATSVNFMLAGGNTILTGTSVNVVSNTSITACGSIEMTTGTPYQVTVTTPAGTSATSPLTY